MSASRIQQALKRRIETHLELRSIEEAEAAAFIECSTVGDLVEFGRCEWVPEQVEVQR